MRGQAKTQAPPAPVPAEFEPELPTRQAREWQWVLTRLRSIGDHRLYTGQISDAAREGLELVLTAFEAEAGL